MAGSIICHERMIFMKGCCFYTAGTTAANACAVRRLQNAGIQFSSAPSADVTHLLLPVPSLQEGSILRGGGDLHQILAPLPKGITIFGGNLPVLDGYRVYDLLKLPAYVAENAYITAHCAVRLIMDRLPLALRGCPILVIGWGRIGKCLAALLKGLEAKVTVAARKDTDRAILGALGYMATDIPGIDPAAYRVILNTVPVMVLPQAPADCLKIDLASQPGLGGGDVIHARGLPGKDAPEASGELIARTVLHYLNKEENP